MDQKEIGETGPQKCKLSASYQMHFVERSKTHHSSRSSWGRSVHCEKL